MIVRRIARPMLAASFVAGGIDALRRPKAKVSSAPGAPAAKSPRSMAADPEQMLKIDAGVQVVGGLMLATNRLPRLSAAVLAVSMVPSTLAAHRFWEEKEPRAARNQQLHFLKNLSLIGGLLIAAADTGGRPSLGWRARRAKTAVKGAKAVKAAGGAVKSRAADALPVG